MSLKDDISSAIEAWIESRRGATLHMLSKLSGVSYNTVLRIAQGEVEPSLKILMLLLPVVLPKEKYGSKASDLLLKYFPETGYFLRSDDEAGIEPLQELSEIENFCKEDFLILSLAATSSGLRKERAFEKLGERAYDSIEKLLKVGVLFDNNGVLFATKKRFKILGHERALNEIKWLIELFDVKLLDRWGSLYRLKTEGLSDEAVYEIHKILDDASDRVGEIVRNPVKHGPNVMGYAIVSTFLDAPKGGQNA